MNLVWTFAPYGLTAAVAIGAHMVSKRVYPDDAVAEAVVRRAEGAIAQAGKHIAENSELEKLRFEVEILRSMLPNVPDEGRADANRAVEAAAAAVTSAAQSFHESSLRSELVSIAQEVSSAAITRDELAAVRKRAESAQKSAGHLTGRRRDAYSSEIVQVFEQLEQIDQTFQDRDRLDDIERSLNLSNSEQDKARKKGEVYVIIQRFAKSAWATSSDMSKARRIAKRIEVSIAQTDGAPSWDENDSQQLVRLLKSRVWSPQDLKHASSLLNGVSGPDADRLKGQVADRKRQVETLSLPDGTTDIGTPKFEAALAMAEQLFAEIRSDSTAPDKAGQATKLLIYVDKYTQERCKNCTNWADKSKRLTVLKTGLRTLGASPKAAVSATPKNASKTPGDSSNSGANSASKLASVRDDINAKLYNGVDGQLRDLKTAGVDVSNLQRKLKAGLSQNWFDAFRTKYFDQNSKPLAGNTVSNDVLRANLELMDDRKLIPKNKHPTWKAMLKNVTQQSP